MGMKWERWAPANGVLFVVAFLVAFFLAGEPPKADDGVAAIREYYSDDGAILTATYILGIGLFLYLSFVGTLAHRLREAGQARLGAVAFAGGIMIASIFMGATILNAALAYRTPADEGILQALYDVQLVSDTIIAFPAAVLVLATALAASRAGVFASWFNAAGAVAGIGFLVGGAAFDADGFFAPRGGYSLIATFVFMAWTVAASGMLTMQAQAVEQAPRPAAAGL